MSNRHIHTFNIQQSIFHTSVSTHKYTQTHLGAGPLGLFIIYRLAGSLNALLTAVIYSHVGTGGERPRYQSTAAAPRCYAKLSKYSLLDVEEHRGQRTSRCQRPNSRNIKYPWKKQSSFIYYLRSKIMCKALFTATRLKKIIL